MPTHGGSLDQSYNKVSKAQTMLKRKNEKIFNVSSLTQANSQEESTKGANRAKVNS